MRRILPALILIFTLIGALSWQFPHALTEDTTLARLLYVTLLLMFIGGSVFLNRHYTSKLRDGMIWLAIFIVFILGYQQRNSLRAALLSEHVFAGDSRVVELYLREDGHFYVDATMNDASVRFMIDTGASQIVLDKRDAKRAGINPDDLAYTQFFSTANGTVRGAPVTLKRLQLGGFSFNNVSASVNGAPLATPLLGLRFLRKHFDVRISDDRMTLTPRTPSGGE